MFPGRVIANRYRIVRVLGRGGMGVVSEAEDLETSAKFAIKFLREDVESDIQPSARFMREAILATRLKNPHSCRVFSIGEWEMGPYIVMELLDGRALSSILERGRKLDWPLAVRLAYEMCSALAEAHRLGIVHRDVKPGNVYLARMPDERVLVKVLDFGVAKIPASVVTKHGERSLTDASTLLGTPSYVAPEQLINSKLVDARADVWAVGVLLYEMLAGQLPFNSPLVPKLLVMIAKEEPAPLATLVTGVPEELIELVHGCLVKKPGDRVADAAALAEALLPWLDTSPRLLEPLLCASSIPPDVVESELPKEFTTFENPHRPTADSLGPHTTANFAKHRRIPGSKALIAAAGAALGLLTAVLYFVTVAGTGRTQPVVAAAAVTLSRDSHLQHAATHSVLIVADPVGARIDVDGTALKGNPVTISKPENEEHELVVAAPGYIPETHRLRFSVDQQLTISLRPELARSSNAVTGPAAPGKSAGRSPHTIDAPKKSTPLTRSLDRENPY